MEVQGQGSPAETALDVFVDFLKLLWFIVICYLKAFYQLFFPPPPKSFVGEKILITGGASGIGKEVCLQLVRAGATVISWDVNDAANQALVGELKADGVDAHAYCVDIGDRGAVEKAAARVKNEIGNVTIIINNAGILSCRGFLEYSPEELERMFDINVLGQYWILREFLPNMIRLQKGHIVTTCSAAGVVGTRNLVAYSSTKHAVRGYTEALKDEILHMPGKPDIKFTTIYPFSARTGMTENVKCGTRFPSILPILTPEFVAEKLIDGMKRNVEHVYVPGLIEFFGIHAKMLLPEVRRAGTDFMEANIEPIGR